VWEGGLYFGGGLLFLRLGRYRLRIWRVTRLFSC
jgi:hypothetical protein